MKTVALNSTLKDYKTLDRKIENMNELNNMKTLSQKIIRLAKEYKKDINEWAKEKRHHSKNDEEHENSLFIYAAFLLTGSVFIGAVPDFMQNVLVPPKEVMEGFTMVSNIMGYIFILAGGVPVVKAGLRDSARGREGGDGHLENKRRKAKDMMNRIALMLSRLRELADTFPEESELRAQADAIVRETEEFVRNSLHQKASGFIFYQIRT